MKRMRINVSISQVWAYLLVFICIAAIVLCTELWNPTVGVHRIISIEPADRVVGDSDRIDTYRRYFVTTESGLYIIETAGINAAPQYASFLRADSTYLLKTRGIRIPFFGRYPRIVGAIKNR